MELTGFWNEVETRLNKYDLLCHSFYKAWSMGELSEADLREYAADYYHHVAAFPTYLSALHSRLAPGELRQSVLRNLCEEEIAGRSHSDLWLDFAAGMGADSEQVRDHEPVQEVGDLVASFRDFAANRSVAAALGAFYAYESQVPRIAQEKARGLQQQYGADAKTCRYFTLHTTADVAHSEVWRQQLNNVIQDEPEAANEVLDGIEQAAQALWRALDGIEQCRQERKSRSANEALVPAS